MSAASEYGTPLDPPPWWWHARTVTVRLIADGLAPFGRSITAPREQVSVEPAGVVVPSGPTGLLVPWALIDDVRPGGSDAPAAWWHPYWPSAEALAAERGEVR